MSNDADPGRESDQSGRDQSGRDQAESGHSESAQPADDPAEGRRWLQLKPPARRGREEEDDDGLGERLTQQLAHQWALIRAERRAEPPPIRAGVSNFDRAQVPWG
ncbi:MAG: hypothetical protein Q8Q44_14510, partial [Nocardioides sp.]|nr:hypothetical protein [Nocardioides sp.]